MTPNDRAGPASHHMLPPMTSGTWLEGGKKLLALYRVSQSAKLARLGWWILVPSWHSLSCPSFPSSFACHAPCALHCSPVLMDDQCRSAHLASWGYCFPLGLPSPTNLPLGDDCRSILCCPIHCANPWDVIRSSGLAATLAPNCDG